MNTTTTVLNLSGIYERESFYRNDKSSRFIDLSDISGTNCYCDEAAAKEIMNRLGYQCGGIHFIDSGNYHYMSALFLSKVKEPFSLVVLDHHPDMQRPMFDILSCGGWVMDVLNNNQFVRDVHIIGADRKLIDELEEDVRERAHFYDVEEDRTGGGWNLLQFLGMAGKDSPVDVILPDTQFPIWLSIDKDVITRDELVTNWDQGETSSSFVISFAKELLNSGREVLGIDICGECAPDQEGIDIDRETSLNDRFNELILDEIKDCAK
jgi:hypothetical protein